MKKVIPFTGAQLPANFSVVLAQQILKGTASRQSPFMQPKAAPVVEIALNSQPSLAQSLWDVQRILTAATIRHLLRLYLSKLNGLTLQLLVLLRL